VLDYYENTNLQVRNGLQLGMFWGMAIIFSHHNSLFEKSLINKDTVLFGHQHPTRKN